MIGFKIKRDPNDVQFSKMIRERDGRCVFCGKRDGQLECSHFWGRGNKATRFDARNCDTLCFQCHANNEGNKQGFYRTFKLSQLGEKEYNDMEKRATGMAHYGEFEKAQIKRILTNQYKRGMHKVAGWVGIQWVARFNNNYVLQNE